jgi:hypothetical protein
MRHNDTEAIIHPGDDSSEPARAIHGASTALEDNVHLIFQLGAVLPLNDDDTPCGFHGWQAMACPSRLLNWPCPAGGAADQRASFPVETRSPIPFRTGPGPLPSRRYSGLMPISFITASISSVSRLKRALVASKLSGPTIR